MGNYYRRLNRNIPTMQKSLEIQLPYIIIFILALVPIFGLSQNTPSFTIIREYNIRDKSSGEKQLKSDYDRLEFFGRSSSLIAKKGKKFGIIDENESVIVPIEYDEIALQKIRNHKLGSYIYLGLIQKDNHYGLLDSTGHLSTPVHFEQRPRFSNHYGTSVSINGKFGGVSPFGEELVPFKYDQPVYLSEEVAIVQDDNRFGVYKLGASLIVPIEFEEIIKYREDSIFVVKKNLKKGVYNDRGRVVLPIIYDDILLRNTFSMQPYLIVSQDKKVGLFTTEGSPVLPIEYDHIDLYHPNGFIVEKGGLHGLLGEKGEWLTPLKYIDYKFENNSKFNSKLEAWRTDQRGYIVFEGENQYDTTAYDDYRTFTSEYIILRKGGELLIADWLGGIKPGTYDEIDCNFDTRKCFVSKDSYYGMIDYQGNKLLPLKYRGFRKLGFDNRYLSFWDENYKVGVMNIDGLVVLPPSYEKIGYSEKAMNDPVYKEKLAFHVKSNGKWGLVSNDGEWLIPPQYDELYYFNDGRAPAQKEGLWGIINKSNEIITPFQYPQIKLSEFGITEAYINGEWVKVDKKGVPKD